MTSKLIWPASGAIDLELFEALYRVAFAEQIQAGIGAIGDFHYLHNGNAKQFDSSGFAVKIIQIAIDLGLRLTLIYAFLDQGSSENGRAFIQPLDASLREFEALHARFKDHPLIQVIPGIHGLEHTSPDAIIAARDLAEKYDVKLQVQLAERESELEIARVHYGTTPLRALKKMGVLDQRIVIVNGVLLDEEEIAMAREHNVSMILCPGACLARGDDFPDASRILREKIPFAVGSDSLALSHNYTPSDDIKWLEFTQRSIQKSMNVLSSQTQTHSLWDLASRLPAKILGNQSAQLLPGCPADLMFLSVVQPCSKPENNYSGTHFINELLFGWGAQVQVTHLMVQGRMILKNGFVDADLSSSYYRLGQWNRAFLRSIQKSAERASVAARQSN